MRTIQKNKRIISFFLAILMTVTFAVAPLSTALAGAVQGQTVAATGFDGDFEEAGSHNGFASWISYNAQGVPFERTTEDKHSGNASLRFNIDATTTGYNEIVSLKNIAVEPNTTYQVMYWAKQTANTGFRQYLHIYDAGTSGWAVNGQGIVQGTTSGWVLKTATITTGTGVTSIGIKCTVDQPGAAQVGQIYFDDISIVKVAFDGGFERVNEDMNFTGWEKSVSTMNASMAYDSETKYEGKGSLRFDVAAAGAGVGKTAFVQSYNAAGNKLVVKENTTYAFSYYVKKNNIANVATFLNFYNADGSNTAWTGTANLGECWGGTTDWKEVTGTFTTGSGVTELLARLSIYGGDAETGGKIWVDGLTIEEVPADINELKAKFDGGFEVAGKFVGSANIFENWAISADNEVEVSRNTDDVHSGTASLMLTKPQGSSSERFVESNSSKQIPVEAGKEYVFSAWMKAVDADATAGYYFMLLRQDWGNTMIVNGLEVKETENGWNRVEASVTIPDGYTSVMLRVAAHGTQSSKTGYFLFDDISLTKNVTTIPPIFDPGFELSGEMVGNPTAPFGTWAFGGESVINIAQDTTDYHSGAASIKFTAPVGNYTYANADSYTNVPLTVEAGETYNFKIWEKLENVSGTICQISIYTPNYATLVFADTTDNGNTFTKGTSENGWTPLTAKVTIPSGVTEVIFRIMVLGTQTGSNPAVFRYDDISMEKQVVLKDKEFDPGFELSGEDVGELGQFGTWEIVNPTSPIEFTRDTEVKKSGEASLKIVKPVGGEYNNIDSLGAVSVTVEPGVTYKLSAWEKTENLNGAIGMMSVYAAGYTATVFEAATNAPDRFTKEETIDGWTKISANVTIPAEVTQVIFRFTVLGTQNGMAPAVFHYDDLAFEKLGVFVTPTYDPGFEISGEAAGLPYVFASWENGTDNGTTDVVISQSTDTYHGGAASLKFTKPAGSTANAFVQNTHYKIPVEGGATYALSSWVKTEEIQGSSYNFMLISQDWLWVKIVDAGALYVAETDGEWSRMEAIVKVPETMTEAIVRVVVQGEQTGKTAKFYFDDISLVKTTPIDTSFDPGFENASPNGKLNAWVDGGGALKYEIDTKEKHSGNSSLKIYRPKNVEGYKIFETAETIAVEPNTTYYIRYYGKALNLSETDNMYILVTGDGMSPTPVSATGNRSSEAWFKESGYITTGATTTAIKLQVCTSGVNGSGKDGTIWFDDILVEKAPAGTGTFDGKFDIILDGEALNWKTFAVPSLDGSLDDFSYEVTESGYESTALTLKKKGSGYIGSVTKDLIPIQAGKSYEVSYYVKAQDAKNCQSYVQIEQYADQAGLTHVASNGYIAGYYVYGSTDGWKKVVVTFTAEKDAVGVKFMATLNDAEVAQGYGRKEIASVTFDEIAIKEVKTLGPTDNFGFEYGYETPRDWTFMAVGTDPNVQLDKSLFGVKMTDNGYQGRAVQLYTDSPSGLACLFSPEVPVDAETQYLLSYYIKMDGSTSARMRVELEQYSESGMANPAYIWPDAKYDAVGASDWVKVTIPITTASDCSRLKIKFHASGAGTVATIDNVELTKLDAAAYKKLNLSFENEDQNWLFVRSGDPESKMKFDTKNYHHGSKSLYFTKNSVASNTTLTGLGRFEVNGGTKLMYGGYFKSNDATISKLKINLNVYDANDKLISTMVGRPLVLNNSSQTSEWTRVAVTSEVPAGAAYASFEVLVTAGQAELWLDDLFYRVVNGNKGETLVDFSDFSAYDEDGNMEGWSHEQTKGDSSFAWKKVSENPIGELQIEAGSEGYMVYDAKYFVPGNTYRIAADYGFSADGKAVIKFFDYNGNYMDGLDVEQEMSASDNGKLDFTFDAPSATTAKLYVGSEEAGTYRFDDLEIYLVDTVDPNQAWQGRWVWYQEDALTEAVKQHRYFIYQFTLEDDPTYAPIQVSVDDNFTLYVNGAEVGGNMGTGQDQWSNPMTFDILKYLKKGENVIAIDAYNVVSYAAAIFDSRITLADGSEVMVVSDDTVVASKTAPDGWNQVGFDCSGWSNVKVIGYPPCSPWGSIYFNTALYADNQVEITSFETPDEIIAGTTIDITATFTIEEEMDTDYPIEVSIWRKNSTKEITAGILEVVDGQTTSKWKVGSNEVKMQLYIPDYMETGRYTLQLSDNYLYLSNEDVIENKFANIKVTQKETKIELADSEVKEYNGKPTVFINDEARAPLFYLEPAGEVWWNLSEEQRIQESETELYVTNSIFLSDPNNRNQDIWLDADTIDFDQFDKYVYQTLSGNPDAMVMIAIGMQAPDWWLDIHPDEESVVEAYDTMTGKSSFENPATRAVSFSSELYMQEAGEVLRQLVEHVKTSSYASHIYGIKIQDGETQEYMIQGGDDWTAVDFSVAAQNAFREYLKETYGTVEALRKAWKDNKVTFENAAIPTYAERGAANDRTLLNIEEDRRTIDFQYFVNTESVDYLLHYTKIIKEASDDKMIAGAYYGYTWNFNTSAANNSAHPGVDKILADETIDFVCSPFVYGERDWTESVAYDDMMDGIQKNGKLYILEVDTRSVYDDPFENADWDSEVGYCYTMEESVNSLKRDFAALLADGAGFWFFNMYGTWWYESQFMQLIADMKDEMYVSTYTETETTSDIAVFVDERMYPYVSGTDVYGSYEMLYFLLANQRRSLAHIGATYDTHHMSDLVNGLASDYKINVMISPFEVTEEEQAAIEKYLKKDDKVIVWIYLPGISDGNTESAKHISDLTGITTKLHNEKALFNAVFTDKAGTMLTDGLDGLKYGNENTALAGPLAFIDDSKATTLATLLYGDDTETALAMKDMGDWTSIYSTVPNLPGEFFTNLLKYTDSHVYSQDSDIIYANNHHVSCYSPYGGEISLKLDGNYSVYDVFAKEYYSMDTDEITYTSKVGETRTFRLMTPNKVTVLARTLGGGELSAPGITELNVGESYELSLKPETGNECSNITVNGVEIDPTNKVKLEKVENYQSVVCYFDEEAENTDVASTADIPVVMIIVCAVILLLIIAIVVFVLVSRKKLQMKGEQ